MVYDNLFCRVYLSSEMEIEELYRYINGMVLGKLEPIRGIVTDWGEIDLRKSCDFDPQILENDPEDFIFWRYNLEIEPKEETAQADYIAHIAKLIKQLNSENMKAVASCDFEEEL